MRIVELQPLAGKNPIRTLLIGVTTGLAWFGLSACTTPTRSLHEPVASPSITLSADDLALVERIQAENFRQAGDFKAAADRLAKAAMLSADPDLCRTALRSALYAGNRLGAQALLARWRGLEPEAPALPAYTVALALAGGDSEAAHAAADQMGTGALQRRHLAEALRWVRPPERVLPFVELRVARSDDLDDWIHWAAFARERRAPEVAMRLADLAVRRFPDQARSHSLRAALIREREPAAAVDDLEQALRLDPKSTDVRLSLAHAYDAAGQATKAAEVVAGIEPATEASVSAEIAYAARAGTPGLLERAYRHLVDQPEPRPAQRLLLLGQVAELLMREETARHWFAEVPEGPHFVAARLRLTSLLLARRDFGPALAQVEALRATGLLARDDLVRSFLLEHEIRLGQDGPQAALVALDAGLRMLPDDGELMYARALAYGEAGREADMERELRRMIELDPEDGDALNALGYTLADGNRNLDEAAALLARAEQIEPDNAALLDSLGWLAFRRGDLAQALEKLRAASLKLKDPEVSAHLGEVLWHSGQQGEARKVWAEARKRDPNHRVLNETMRRLLP